MKSNFLCFECGERFTTGQEDLYPFSNSYGDWQGVKCPYCKDGDAKFVGNPAGLAFDISQNNKFTALREGRREHRDALLQPFRSGEFSKEFKEAHPEATKKMIQDKQITIDQANNAKNVWNGDEL